jgi:mono/diheme cytochrome c family protein
MQPQPFPSANPVTTEWPEPPPKIAQFAAYVLALITVMIVGIQFIREWQRILPLRSVDLHLWAEMPEQGGWHGDSLRVPSGQSVHLTVHGVAGDHTFALAYTDVASSRLLQPGESETVTFVAPAPGRYVLYCTTWCSPNHWRMRTVLEVYPPEDATAPLSYPQLTARYNIMIKPHALDAPHLADTWPTTRPDAAQGATLWTQAAPAEAPQELVAQLAWPNAAPADAYTALQGGRFPSLAVADKSEAELWALVAFLWQAQTTRAALAQGEQLYTQNCVACHGEQGRGDGFAAPLSVGQEPDFTDLRAAAGASPALLYAKIARGGMGTGMPNWGTLLSDDELWALVDYVQSFTYSPGLHEE